MPEHELVYLNLGGRATPIRLMLAYLGIEFKDSTYDLKTEWPKIKESFPFEQGPVLIIDKSFKLAQTPAILQYLGKEYGLYPQASKDQALADMYAHQCQDAILAYRPWLWTIMNNESPEKIEETWKTTGFPEFKNKFAKFFERQLKENGTGFLVGDKITWVDFLAAYVSEYIERFGKGAVFDEYPLLKKHFQLIYNDPKIAEVVKKERSYVL